MAIEWTPFEVVTGLSLLYLLFTTFVLLWNRQQLTGLRRVKEDELPDAQPKVSILIPARNEEKSIEACVRSACLQTYFPMEVVVLDDGSTDETPQLLEMLRYQFPDTLRTLEGASKPDEWLGKPWACHQLGKAAEGELLLFIDADTMLQEGMVAAVVQTMETDRIDFLTVWPDQELGSFWERVLVPMVYHALLTLLPARYVYKAPRWIPKPLRAATAPLFAAACGQCLAFRSEAYEEIGGHSTVKDQVVEDVELAKAIKKSGFAMRMYHGLKTIQCRMYETEQEIRTGFRKNFFAGFGYSLSLFLLMAVIHLVVYLAPPFLFLFAIITGNVLLAGLSALVLSIPILQRMLLARWFGWPAWFALTHILGVAWFQYLGTLTIYDYLGRKPVSWKGRTVTGRNG